MWKRVVRAKTKALFFEAWTKLCEEFTDQEAILQYLQFEYLSVHEQWAEYAIRYHLNYGQTTTSQSESSNHCIKTYLVSGKCDFYGLIRRYGRWLGITRKITNKRSLKVRLGFGILMSSRRTWEISVCS